MKNEYVDMNLFFLFFTIVFNSPLQKKSISISPGGYNGFYMLGICAYIKKHYPMDEYLYIGSSAGAWAALFMTYKGEPDTFIKIILDTSMELPNAIDVKEKLKNKILTTWNTSDFDLHRLLVHISIIQNYTIVPIVYTLFDNLEDAINACIASSHIPFFTGTSCTQKYQNMYSLDGGLTTLPKQQQSSVLHISPTLWNEKQSCQKITEYTSLWKRDKQKYNFHTLFANGYMNAETNKLSLDNVFFR